MLSWQSYVSCELSDPVQRRDSLDQVVMAASCDAGMTETSPICTLGALKVSLLSHLECHAE